jgi:hypothetical protein
MAKKNRSKAPANETTAPLSEEEVYASNLTLHELFQQQTTKMLDRADLSEEQKQSILIAISCPCCGAGGLSFTMKLRR